MPNEDEKREKASSKILTELGQLSERVEKIEGGFNSLGKKLDKAIDTIAHAIPSPPKVAHKNETKPSQAPQTQYVIPPMGAIINHILGGDKGNPCPNCYPKVEKAILEKHKDRFILKDQVPSLEGFVKLDDLKGAEFGCKDCGFPLPDPKKINNCPMCGGTKYAKR